MQTISLCMIVRNEEENIANVLTSAKDIVDEIIIVDTGSTDNTKIIAKEFTDKIYDFEWCDDFSKARNYSFSLATSDYIMWLDADDIVPFETAMYIKKLKENMHADTYMFQYKTGDFSYHYRERILRNNANATWVGPIHECITPFGKIEKINAPIHHNRSNNKDPNRNLKIFRKILKERKLNPRETYYYARELFDHKYYRTAIKIFKKFIRLGDGWIEDIINSYYMIGLSYIYLGDTISARYYLTSSLLHHEPRSNILNLIADCYYYENNYILAIHWYKLSINKCIVSHNAGFMDITHTKYYSLLKLSMCYYKSGDIINAIVFNEEAGKEYESKEVMQNRKYFTSLIKK